MLVNPRGAKRKVVTFIAITSGVCAASLGFLFAYNFAIQPVPTDGPVERWIQIGFERRHLEDLNSLTVMIEPGDYEAEKQRLIAKEDEILADYPRDLAGYQADQKERATGTSWPFAFWTALAATVALSMTTISWLLGNATADQHDA